MVTFAVRNFSVSAAGRVLFLPLSFKLAMHDCALLTAPSGFGKSVALRGFCALHSNDLHYSGEVLLDDFAVNRERAALKMVYIPQDIGAVIDPLATGFEFLKRSNQNISRSECTAVLESLEMPDIDRTLNSQPEFFSLGMKQRFAVAAALLRNPSVLLCDEPTAALDLISQTAVLRAIKNYVDSTDSMAIVASHELFAVKPFTNVEVKLERT